MNLYNIKYDLRTDKIHSENQNQSIAFGYNIKTSMFAVILL